MLGGLAYVSIYETGMRYTGLVLALSGIDWLHNATWCTRSGVMAQQLMFQPPPALDFESRQLGHTWKTWKQQFGIFLTASDNDKASEKKKVSILLHSLGTEGIEIYNTFVFELPEERSEPTYAEVIKKFDEYFLPCVNVTLTFEQHLFIHRDQLPGETLDRYLTALRTCEFGQLKDSLVRDRFICGLSNTAVKEKLMATGSDVGNGLRQMQDG